MFQNLHYFEYTKPQSFGFLYYLDFQKNYQLEKYFHPQVGHFCFRFISTRLTSCKLAKFAKRIISFNASQGSECTPDGKFPLSLFIAILKRSRFYIFDFMLL